MNDYKAPLNDMRFVLHDVFSASEQWASFSSMKEVIDKDTANAMLEEAAKLTSSLISPLNRTGDEQGAHLNQDGNVITPDGFKEAYKVYAEGGWVGFTGNPEYGGMGMPKMLSVFVEEMLYSANNSFTLYPCLTAGACLAISAHGSESLKSTYLPKLYSGEWSGTMCLTEPHAGTDLGLIRTKAEPQSDGSYAISGTKIFITAGDHDLTDNIVHLVLAKLPDSPGGTRGISLFLVPKFLNEKGTEKRNAVSCGSLEHKMGIKASATCVMNFDGASGYLIGAENKGLAAMFTMMNYERLSIGLQGIGCSQRSFQTALEYADERLQSRVPSGSVSPEKAADPIVELPDVKRMLMLQKSITEGSRAFAVYAAMHLDIAKFSDDEKQRNQSAARAALLTPVCKAFFTDLGLESTIHGQQVLGGHGYIREWGQEQLVRDARIAQIYEGTNGIQALDLIGRKVFANQGKDVDDFVNEISSWLEETKYDSIDKEIAALMLQSCSRLTRVTQHLLERGQNSPNALNAHAVDYLHLFGYTALAYMFIRMSKVALEYPDRDFSRAKLSTAEFYFNQVLPRSLYLEQAITAGDEALSSTHRSQLHSAW